MSDAVEKLLSDPASAAAAPLDVALVAVEAARAQSRPDLLWALAEHPAREVAKAARRALHLLRSRGVAVGEKPGTPSHRAVFAEPEGAPEPCRATAIDGFGDFGLWIPLKRAQGFELWSVVLSDERGVVEALSAEVSRKQLHAHFASLPEEVRHHELPRDRAAGLLAEAITRGGAPRPLAEARTLLERLGGGDPARTQPASATASAPADEAQRLAESPALFDEPELSSYVPAEDLLRELALKLDEVAVSPLLVDDRQRTERVQQVLDSAVERFFTPERRARYARRLFDLCDLWGEEGRPEPAARAAATARQLAGAAPILENPFARRMFHRIFEGAPADGAPKPEEQRPSGLILPGSR